MQPQAAQRRSRELDATFEANREQQQDAQQFVDGRRYLEIGFCDARQDAEQEEQDDGINTQRF